MSREAKIIQFHGAKTMPGNSSDDLSLQIDVRLRIDDRSIAGEKAAPGLAKSSSDNLHRLAGAIYDARRKRDKMLAGEFFGEPAWDMLLALYCFPARGESLSVTSLSYAANVAPSTGHRVQAALGADGLIERVQESRDGRRLIVNLTEKGRRLLEGYLTTLIGSNQTLPAYLGLAAT